MINLRYEGASRDARHESIDESDESKMNKICVYWTSNVLCACIFV